jgi:cysteinyl-tRNA synthetase
MPQTIKLYNTKTRELDIFSPLHEGNVGIYSCGPTVYHYAHIGNLRAYVFADILRRTLISAGYTVTHLINITDVGHLVGDGDTGEDKLEKGAAREGKGAFEIAKFYTDAFLEDITALGIPLDAYTFPRATDHIQEQINLILKLEYRGYTYAISDGIYFDTSKYVHYADFAKLDTKGLQSGARVEENKEKRNHTDFALWKFSPKDEQRQMEWDSPWGKGFPGWHIECSAMSMKYLGNHFDIHTGGIDHIPVHHTNEIAQSTCSTGEEYVNYWMHVNFLQDTTGKMSKSNEDFLTLKTIIDKGYSPFAYRYFLLMTHYTKEILFSYEALDAASHAYSKVSEYMVRLKGSEGIVQKEYITLATDALYNDLNTSTAIATIWKLIKDEAVSDADTYTTLLAINQLLGLGLEPGMLKKEELVIPHEVQLLLDARAHARATKNFQESDKLRDQIHKAGFLVKDTPSGQDIIKT